MDCGYGVDMDLPGQNKDQLARKVHVIAGVDGGMELHGDDVDRVFKQLELRVYVDRRKEARFRWIHMPSLVQREI